MDKNETTNIINNDLLQISKWAYNWKMSFNPDPKNWPRGSIFKNKQSTSSSNHKS